MSSEEVRIDYKHGQYGWSEFRLNVEAASVVVGPFSYCSDALGDLVRAALTIATSGCRAEVSFDGEPMEWRLAAAPHWDEARSRHFCLRVLTFPSANLPPNPEAERDKVFEAQCSEDSFVRAVLKAAQSVWDEYGTVDRLWGGPSGFPVRALSALKTALSVEEPRRTWLPPRK